MGGTRAVVDRMAHSTCHREAGDRHCLASTRRPPVVDLEESASSGSAYHAHRRADAHSHHGGGQSALGRAANPWRTFESGDRRLAGDGREIHRASTPATIPDVAHVPAESRGPDRGGRLLCRADGNVSPRFRPGAPLTTDDASGTSPSPPIRRRRGRPNSCARRFPGTTRPVT